MTSSHFYETTLRDIVAISGAEVTQWKQRKSLRCIVKTLVRTLQKTTVKSNAVTKLAFFFFFMKLKKSHHTAYLSPVLSQHFSRCIVKLICFNVPGTLTYICCGWHEFYHTFATMHRLVRMPQTCLLRLVNSMGHFLACHNLELFLQSIILEHSCGHLPGHSLGHRTVFRQY